MVTESPRTLKNRLGMLQIVGMPILQYAAKHTFIIMWILRLNGILENGIRRYGRLPMEINAMISGVIGNYKFCFWSAPIYNDCSRWSFKVVRLAV